MCSLLVLHQSRYYSIKNYNCTRHKSDYEYDGKTHKVCINWFRPIASAMSMPAPISHIVHNYYWPTHTWYLQVCDHVQWYQKTTNIESLLMVWLWHEVYLTADCVHLLLVFIIHSLFLYDVCDWVGKPQLRIVGYIYWEILSFLMKPCFC